MSAEISSDVLAGVLAGLVPRETHKELPKKPGIRTYEHVPCLVRFEGEWEVCLWNCEHECWDDSEGDDHRYNPLGPTHWLPLSALDDVLKVGGSL